MNPGLLSRFHSTPARCTVIGLALLSVALPAWLFAQQEFASLEEQMTGEEFRAAGLEKLSTDELATLNEWIRARSLATLDAPRYSTSGSLGAGSGSANVEKPDIEGMPREPIVTRIVGSFSGWDGQTVFRLENGMIWTQADKDKFYIQELQSPTVTIKPAMFGAWKLSIEGYEKNCRVERIQ